jgi:anti-sigma regulatory factor (Ser/Thr protein kinase)
MDWFDLEDSPSAPRAARQLVRSMLGPSASGERLVTSELLVSEMVSNAVLHAMGPLSIGVDCADHRLRVEVRDGDAATAADVAQAERDIGGWGLRLVDMLASRWGTSFIEGGKVVWFELQLD